MNPQTLDHAGIALRVPHAGAMCLLHRLCRWSPERIECAAISHTDRDNPLRLQGQLPAAAAIEYAAQAMALHATLGAAPGAAPMPGFLVSVRDVRLFVPRLDDVAGEIVVIADLLAGDLRQASYTFALRDAASAPLVQGRATVVLNARPQGSPA